MLNFLKIAAKKNKKLFYLFHYWRTKFEIARNKEIIIVHTPGHVASSTVFKSLKSHQPPLPYLLLDVHSLNERWNNNSIIPSTSARHVVQDVLRDSLPQLARKKKIKIISLVRDPVSRALGGYFQGYKNWNQQTSLNRIQDFEKEFKELYVKMTGSDYRQSYLHGTIQYQATWFDKQVKPFFEINLEEDLVKKQPDYQLYKKGNVELLILKVERLNQSFTEAMEDFIKEKVSLVISNDHRSRADANAEFYSYYKKNFKLASAVVDEIYNSSFVKRFYSDIEIENYKNTWKQ